MNNFKMKRLNQFLITSIIILFTSCSGSETYRGKWFGTGPNEEVVEFIFEENKFVLLEGDSQKEYEYSQNSVKFENSSETYGIKTDDGKTFQLHFPSESTKGAFLDSNGNILYIIGREKGVKYEDVFGLK